MQFASIQFVFYFLPLFLAVYYIFPEGKRHLPLLIGSLIFYGLSSGGDYWWVGILAGCTLVTYLAGLTLHKSGRGVLLALYLIVMASTLVFFKLWNGGTMLPSGMSFFLFQMVAYLIDVYRQRIAPERNILVFSARVTMFPKLLSGPILTGRQMCRPASGKMFHNLRDGLHLLIFGLGMKVLLANRIGGLWTQAGVTGFEHISVPGAWLALIAYAMQLYFDFYGYSLMAMGLGKMLGYELPKNFDAPYASRSVSEFYRRWHITLGAWFREYLYIPMGGSRCGFLRTVLNLAVVWLFTGLWHGVGGNYLLWAGFLFVLIVNERLWLNRLLKKSHILSRIYLVFVILISWVPFAVGDWNQMVVFLGRLFGLRGAAINPMDFVISAQDYWPLLAAGVFFATPIPGKVWDKIRKNSAVDPFLAVLFWVIVYFISTSAQDPFLYFQY